MKQLQLILLTATFSLVVVKYSAQSCPEYVKTDPRNPINSDRPELANTFFWFPHNGNNHSSFEILTSGGDYPSINNPFWVPTSLMVGQLVDLQNSDFYPEDGWELLKINFGKLNDGTERDNKPSMPYMILYNRYSGTMRFLGMWPNASNSWQIIRFTIGIPQEKWTSNPNNAGSPLDASNLLSVQGDAMQALDQQTEETVYEVITEYPGISNASYFFWFDLPVAYDPCICNNDVAITLEATVENEWDVTVKGVLDALVIQEGSSTNNNHSSLMTKRVLGLAGATVQAIATGGSVINTGGFTGLLDIFSERPGVSDRTEASIELLQGALNAAGEVTYDSNKLEWRNTVTGDTLSNSDWNKLFSGIGSFLNSGVDFVNPSAKASQPRTSVVGTITASGTANFNSQTGDLVYLGLPGSDWTSSLAETVESSSNGLNPEYPIYNNPLGTFALLETPLINVKTDEISLCVDSVYDEDLDEDRYGREPRTVFTLFFDNEELHYYFNPILNRDKETFSIKASIVVKSKTGGFLNNIYGDESSTLCTSTTVNGINEFSLLRGTNIYESVDSKERISPPVDIDYLNDMVVIFTANQANLSFSDYDFFIRFNIIGKSNDVGKDGSANEINQVVSFALNPVEYTGQSPTPPDLNDIPAEIVDIQNYPSTINPYQLPLTFQSNQPVPYQPGNNAWDDDFVVIETEISSPNELSTISSASGIRLKSGTSLLNSLNLKVGPPLEGTLDQPEANNQYVSDFCSGLNNSAYQANVFSITAPKLPPVNQEFIQKAFYTEHSNEINIFPNPANNYLTVVASIDRIRAVTIHDLSNRTIQQSNFTSTAKSQVQIDLSKVASGIYIVRIDCGEEVFSEKLVVSK